jgi:hypothetical protein
MAMSEPAGGALAASIWDRIISADDNVLSPDEARALLRWKFTESDRQGRMNFPRRLVGGNLRRPRSANSTNTSQSNPLSSV